MVSWWPGEGDANDIQGGNNGTLVNGATFAAGKVGIAFSLDGVDDSIQVPDSPSLNFDSNSTITIDLWAFRTASSTIGNLIGKRSGCGSFNYAIAYDPTNGLHFNSSSGGAFTGIQLPLNTWTHLAGSFDGTNYRFYINGVLSMTAPGTFGPTNSAPLTIGRSGSCEPFGGLIDEVEIFNRALSASEIQSIFNAGSDGKCRVPSLSINDVVVTEGNTGTTNATFTISVVRPNSTAITVDYASADGSATAPSDYASASGTLTVPANTASATITIAVNGDTPLEPDETFFVNLSNPANAVINDAQGIGTIVNDDCFPPPAGMVAWWPGDGNANDIQGTNNGTLQGGVFFTAARVGQGFAFDSDDDRVTVAHNNSLDINSPGFSADFWMRGIKNQPQSLFAVFEKSHGFGDSTGWAFQGNSATGTIDFVAGNGSGFPFVSSTVDVLDGNFHLIAGTWNGSEIRLYVDGVLQGSPAALTTPANNTRSVNIGFASGGLSQNPQRFFRGIADELEVFNRALAISEIQSIYIAGSAGKCRPAVPNLLINDVTVAEGNSGTTGATFTVTASQPTGVPITVNYATADGTATAPSDYASASGTLTIPANTTSATITIAVNGDTTFELDETFFVNLSAPANANILDGQGVCTILNDDCFAPPAGMVAHWPGENNANDIQGGNNGTLENGTTFAAGEVGQAFSFDGVGSSVLNPTIGIGSAFTVELWIFPINSAVSLQHMVSNGLQSQNYGALVFTGGVVAYYQGGGPQAASGSIPLNAWTHVGLTYDGSVDRLYINGSLAGMSPNHAENFNNALRFGYDVVAQNNRFQGRLDEITLYSRVLSSNEILSIFSARGAGKCTGGSWTGAMSSDWNTPGNWSSGQVPNASSDVTIAATGVANNPAISGGDVTINSLTIATGRTLTINSGRTLTINDYSTNGGAVTGAGTMTLPGSALINGGTVSVANVNFSHIGTQSLAGAGSFSSNTATVTAGSLLMLLSDPQMAALVVQSGATMDISSRTLRLSGSLTNNGALTATGSTIVANGTTPQTLITPSFHSLTINNLAGVSLGSNATLAGTLTLTTDLTTGGFILEMSNAGASAGSGDVIGNLRRTGVFFLDLSYGNPFTRIKCSGGNPPNDINVNLVKAPPPDFGNSVRRTYTITPNGGSGFSAAVRLHYLDAELNGNDEATLQLWRRDGASWASQGATSRDATDNWVETTGVTQFSPWTIGGPGGPTAIDLASFDATAYDDGVFIEWQTGFEVNNLGFNIYRQEAGKLTTVNQQLIAGSALKFGQGIGLRSGFSYCWWDKGNANCGSGISDCQNVSYWIEDVDLNGKSTWHGPVAPLSAFGKERPSRIEQARTLASLAGTTTPSLPLLPVTKLARPTASALQLQASIASGSALKIGVKRTGFYRLTAEELSMAGLDPMVDPRLLQLFVDGHEQPISVIGEQDGRLDPTDAIEFYGLGVDSPFSDSRVYWLTVGKQPGLRIVSVPAFAKPNPGGSFAYTVERRDRTVYFSGLLNGDLENFFGALVATQPVYQALNVRHLDPSASEAATLEVALQGVKQQPHRIAVQLNGSTVGYISFNGQSHSTNTFSVPSALLTEGDNQVRLATSGDPADVSLVDWIRLTYRHTYVADGDALMLTAQGQQSLTITGFSNKSIRVLDVTDPNAVLELSGEIAEQDSGYAVGFQVPGAGQRTLLALTDEQFSRAARIVADSPSSWRSPSNGADLVIVTRRELMSAVQPLKLARQAQGLSVAVVDVEDVYDEFSYGQKTPAAIKDFLLFAKASWKKAPRFVLLAGDASYDSKDYLGFGDHDFIPTRLIDTQFMETASDDWLVDFDGNGLPDLAVGRLPVRDAEEASNMVHKIISYERSGQSDEALLVSDANDGFDFERASDDLRSLIPSNLRITQVNRGRLTGEMARRSLFEALYRKQFLVNYVGHGSVGQWKANLLTAEDARDLRNEDHPPLFVMMTCLNGYFHDAAMDSLGEALMKAEHGGAVAVWASSGMTFPAVQAALNQELYRLIYNQGPAITIGEAAARAKASVGDPDVRRTWVLLGDPATRLK